MNVKFLMKFLSIVLVCNAFFYMKYLNTAERSLTMMRAEQLLGKSLLQAIEESNRNELDKKIPLGKLLNEQIKDLPTESDKEQECLSSEKDLSVPYSIEITCTCKDYPNNNRQGNH